MKLGFTKPVPLTSPNVLSSSTEKAVQLFSKFGGDENYKNLTEGVVNAQLHFGRRHLEDIQDELHEDIETEPVFLTPSLHFAKGRIYADWLNRAFGGVVATSGDYVYYVCGSSLNDITRRNISSSEETDVVIVGVTTEGPIEQIAVSRRFIVAKAAKEISVYSSETFNPVLRCEHELLVEKIDIATSSLMVCFSDGQEIFSLTEKGLKKLILKSSVEDLRFLDDYRLRYSAGSKVFEYHMDRETVVFDTTHFEKETTIWKIEQSLTDPNILYYITCHDVYAVDTKSRGEFLDHYRHDNDMQPRYASIVTIGNCELVLFAAAIGRIQVFTSKVSKNRVEISNNVSIDTVAQTMQDLPVIGDVFPSYQAIDRLASPTVGVAAFPRDSAIDILIQNVYGDIFYVTSSEGGSDLPEVYNKWLKKFERQTNYVVMTGIVPIDEETVKGLYDFESGDEDYWDS